MKQNNYHNQISKAGEELIRGFDDGIKDAKTHELPFCFRKYKSAENLICNDCKVKIRCKCSTLITGIIRGR